MQATCCLPSYLAPSQPSIGNLTLDSLSFQLGNSNPGPTARASPDRKKNSHLTSHPRAPPPDRAPRFPPNLSCLSPPPPPPPPLPMTQRWRLRARGDPDLDDDDGSPPAELRRSDDDEELGNEDLSLEIVARAVRRQRKSRARGSADSRSPSSDEEVDEDAVVELGEAPEPRSKQRKKQRREAAPAARRRR
jgi:hypothetical protein